MEESTSLVGWLAGWLVFHHDAPNGAWASHSFWEVIPPMIVTMCMVVCVIAYASRCSKLTYVCKYAPLSCWILCTVVVCDLNFTGACQDKLAPVGQSR